MRDILRVEGGEGEGHRCLLGGGRMPPMSPFGYATACEAYPRWSHSFSILKNMGLISKSQSTLTPNVELQPAKFQFFKFMFFRVSRTYWMCNKQIFSFLGNLNLWGHCSTMWHLANWNLSKWAKKFPAYPRWSHSLSILKNMGLSKS